jgi:pyridoxal phosphate enzyme (YggS family)
MTDLVDTIRERYARVRDAISAAAQRGGRGAETVRLVVVTKMQPVEVVRAAIDAGAQILGENYAEEAADKIAALGPQSGVEWHMIGHVQSRKASSVVGPFELVHSVDRTKLAARLDRAAAEAHLRLRCLLECNVSGEASKEGWDLAHAQGQPSAVDEMVEVARLPGLEVVGLMTMAPLAADPETVRPVFHRLADLRRHLEARSPGPWVELSMGMTDDFEVAIEEGATMVRIGRAIFGERS